MLTVKANLGQWRCPSDSQVNTVILLVVRLVEVIQINYSDYSIIQIKPWLTGENCSIYWGFVKQTTPLNYTLANRIIRLMECEAKIVASCHIRPVNCKILPGKWSPIKRFRLNGVELRICLHCNTLRTITFDPIPITSPTTSILHDSNYDCNKWNIAICETREWHSQFI